MALPIIPVAVGTVMIGRKVQKVVKVSDTIIRVWPALSSVATKSINAIVRVLNRMSVLLGEQSRYSSIWAVARTVVEESAAICILSLRFRNIEGNCNKFLCKAF